MNSDRLSLFNTHNPVGIKPLTRLRLGLSHLNEHRFNHKFQNCINLKCICSSENESTTHFFLHCHYYIPIRATLFDKLNETVDNLQELSDQSITEMLLYGSPNLKGNQNSQVLDCTIKHIMNSKRFTGSLFECVGLRFLLFFINPLIFLKSINNNTKKLYCHKKYFSSSCLVLNLQSLH